MLQADGLRFQKDVLLRKTRRMPAPGQVSVREGDLVSPETIVARGTVLNPEIHEVRIHAQLDIDPTEIEKYMLKTAGDDVKKDEIIAIHRSFFGRYTKVCRSPIDGIIESLSKSSGRVLIRGKPIPVDVRAYVPGRVVDTIPNEGAVIECQASIIQGVFGIGGETVGELIMAVNEPDETLPAELISPKHKAKVIAGGSFVTIDAIRRAARSGVHGIISGGMDQKDLTDFLGYEMGVGITGREKAGLTLILTEGFGVHPMEEGVFNLLKSHQGKQVSIDGSTQIRTRMLRPEIIIPE